ncbi:hypothetical protein [uncultured Desulfobacter sp.]|uniref:hypothetical protein n=1 Tax=uncultured Desulfobacter sp. TaxID=240139 RepID=UPI002AAB41EC|nr:hypothetical protein [uncultured Desulfobacter sp.]
MRANQSVKVAGMLTVILLIIALPALVMSMALKKIKPGKTDTKMMVINADNAWLNTGFVVKPSDRITIKATGQIRFPNGEVHSETSPAGYKREAYEKDFVLDDAANCFDPLRLDPHAGLIGKDSQWMFYIGKDKVLTGKKVHCSSVSMTVLLKRIFIIPVCSRLI